MLVSGGSGAAKAIEMRSQPYMGLSLRVLGPFSLSRDGREIAVAGLKTRALLAYLACNAGAPQSRDRLIGLLWGERFEEQARQSLRHALSEIRKVLDADVLETEHDQVCIDHRFPSDIARFDLLMASGDGGSRQDAVALYRGDLLADVSLRERPFMDWLGAERARLRALVADALEQLIDGDATLTPIKRLELARRAIAHDAYRELAHRQLLQALVQLGRRNEAVAHYRQLERTLRAELDVKPEPATRALFADLRREATGENATTSTRRTEADRASPDVRHPAAATAKPAIAVLPFANLSDDPQQTYFSDGVTEDVIIELSRFQQLALVPRSTASRFRAPDLDLRSVGHELGVHYLVAGSIRRQGAEMRITAELIDTESGAQIWAERFDRDQNEIFAVQDEIVRTIVGTLVGRVRAAGAERARRKPPANLAAYECVLRANALPLGDVATEAEKRRLHEKAIELDPDYAIAYAMLAHIVSLAWFRDMSGSTVALERAFELARKAVALDGNNSTCQFVLGWIHLFRKSFELAEGCYQRALDLNPNDPEQIARMGFLQTFLGKPDEALSWLKQARVVDPYFSPVWYSHSLGYAHFIARQYDEAIAALGRSSTMPFWVQAYLTASHALMNRTDRARDLATDLLRSTPDFSSGRLAAKEPFKRPEDREHLLDGLQKAGLPP